jgi:catechol 2,3-dioxygenase-like lactoylglutathione lyase family enzyme
MLESARAAAALPAQDLDRATAWYAQKLGLEPAREMAGGAEKEYELAGSRFTVFSSTGAPSGTHTQMAFIVDDVDAVAKWLRQRGVEFLDYEGLDQDRGIATMGNERGGWFKDSEGNLIGLAQELG